MPFEYSVDRERKLVVVRPDATPTIGDWISLLDRLATDPAFRPDYGIISDRRHLTIAPSVEYVRASIQAIADRREHFGSSRWAILTSHMASYGMARMAEAYADNRGIAFRVFLDDEKGAVRWAGGGD
jgi:hypothetical protein